MINGALLARQGLLTGILLMVPGGCQVGPSETPATIAEAGVALEAPTAEDAASATYAGIYEEPITLSEGRYEGEPFVPDGASRPTVGLLDELQLVGDLDSDGADERIVLLWETSGGSGTNLYVASLRAGGEGVAAFVGDRVEIRTLTRQDNLLQMDVLRAGADDAMCCPGELATLRWQGTAGGLGLVSDEINGRFDLATVAGEWRLATEKAVQEARITLVIRTDGSVSGRSGCNQYSGTARLSAPNEIAIGPLAVTEMACSQPVMALEQAFLSRLLAAARVGFHMGKLAVGWQTEDDGAGTLLFVLR